MILRPKGALKKETGGQDHRRENTGFAKGYIDANSGLAGGGFILAGKAIFVKHRAEGFLLSGAS